MNRAKKDRSVIACYSL